MFGLGIALELDAQATPLNQDVYLRLTILLSHIPWRAPAWPVCCGFDSFNMWLNLLELLWNLGHICVRLQNRQIEYELKVRQKGRVPS